jgi:hypothetical protein
MYTLSSDIQITGKNRIRFDYVHNVKVDSHTQRLTDTAIVQLPRKLSWRDEQLYGLVKRGDQIVIKLGYDGRLNSVFTGYINRVQMGTPIIIECEDEMWPLKRNKLTAKTWTSVKLSELLAYVLPSGTKTIVADLNLGEVKIENQPTAAQVLEFLRSTYNLSVFFREGTLFAVLPSYFTANEAGFKPVIFNKHYNVVYGSDQLRFTREDELRIAIVAKAITRANLVLETRIPEIPVEGEQIRTFYAPHAQSLNELKQFAQNQFDFFNVDRMDGKFTAFGEPFVRKGEVIKYIDPEWPDRSGMSFSIDGVTYEFGLSGYRQHIELGGRVS